MINHDLDHKQRMIFVGLRRMTDDRNLIVDGFRHWMNNHSNETLDIDSVVLSLVSYLGLGSAEKKSLILALHVAANKLASDLPEVPKSLLERVSANDNKLSPVEIDVKSKAEVKKSSPPHCVVTSAYLKTLTQLLIKHDKGAFDELRSILVAEGFEGLQKNMASSIKNWASTGLSNLVIPETVSEDDCKTLSHEFYLLLSEVIGPMDADVLVNAAINITKNIDEATDFHPRNLL